VGFWSTLFGLDPPDPGTRCDVLATYKIRDEDLIFSSLDSLLDQSPGFIKLLQGQKIDLLFEDCVSARAFVAKANRLRLPVVFRVGKGYSV
jgi:hypothetical protein